MNELPRKTRPDPLDTGEAYGVAVPSDRLSRALRMGGLAGGIGARVLAKGAQELLTGKRPDPRHLVFTPRNAQKIAASLSKMRGAAMKVGQLMSMDAGDVMPVEIAAILDRLRDDAEPMPPQQLREVLNRAWGSGWLKQFARFDVRPIAAASIGQVHRARTKDGRILAIKVQYPGIRHAIDSDVDNVSTILKYSGIVPKSLNLAQFLADAKEQLHDEANYIREAKELSHFAGLMEDDPHFIVPKPAEEFCTEDVLAMDFIDSRPLTELERAPQETRDSVAHRLIDLVLRELFVFRAMQTDPNFANYRFQSETGRLVLLDFGATRHFDEALIARFHRLMTTGLDADRAGAEDAAAALELLSPDWPARRREISMDMFDRAMTVIRTDTLFDFGKSDLFDQLRDMGLEIGTEREFWHLPATDTLFIQRKVAGTYLLAARLRAQVNLHQIVTRYR